MSAPALRPVRCAPFRGRLPGRCAGLRSRLSGRPALWPGRCGQLGPPSTAPRWGSAPGGAWAIAAGPRPSPGLAASPPGVAAAAAPAPAAGRLRPPSRRGPARGLRPGLRCAAGPWRGPSAPLRPGRCPAGRPWVPPGGHRPCGAAAGRGPPPSGGCGPLAGPLRAAPPPRRLRGCPGASPGALAAAAATRYHPGDHRSRPRQAPPSRGRP